MDAYETRKPFIHPQLAHRQSPCPKADEPHELAPPRHGDHERTQPLPRHTAPSAVGTRTQTPQPAQPTHLPASIGRQAARLFRQNHEPRWQEHGHSRYARLPLRDRGRGASITGTRACPRQAPASRGPRRHGPRIAIHERFQHPRRAQGGARSRGTAGADRGRETPARGRGGQGSVAGAIHCRAAHHHWHGFCCEDCVGICKRCARRCVLIALRYEALVFMGGWRCLFTWLGMENSWRCGGRP
ncbi:uncharacterized protein J3D65DRAFT_106704 [Phyllosticta citribraziliensis]|uniref:Uncharacterized protein n=1 Tax=Phyllosticta citribraziliensis TaxID=989973 RepID=A0ABR1LCP7_9PEZI